MRLDISRKRLALAAFTTIYFVLTVAMIAWSEGPAHHIAEAWFANALLVAALLRGWLKSMPKTLAAGYLAAVLAFMAMGQQFLPTLLIALANMAEVAVAVWLSRLFGLRTGVMLSERFFLLGFFATMVAAPFVGALIGTSAVHQMFGSDWNATFMTWWAGDAVGMLLLLPPALTFDSRRLHRLLAGDRAPVFWILLPLSLGVTALAMTRSATPFVLIVVPLLLIAYRLGLLGTTLIASLNVVAILLLRVAESMGSVTVPALHAMHEGELVLYATLAVMSPVLIAMVVARHKGIASRLDKATTQLRVFADNIPGIASQLDAHGQYVFVNRKYLEWYGKESSEIIGKTPREVFGDDFARAIAPRVSRVLQGESQHFEITMPEGHRVQVQYEPYLRGSRVEGFFVLAQDITERRELEARLHEITDNVPALIAYLDHERVYRFANARYLSMWGLSPEELIGQPADNVLKARYADILRPKQMACLEGQRVTAEIERDGRFYELTYVPHRVNGVIRGMYKLGIDITERKLAEAALFEEKDRAQRMLNAIGDAVVACDANLCVSLMNPVAERMTGWKEAEAQGRSFAEVVQLVDIDSGETIANPLEKAVRENRVTTLAANSAVRRRDGIETPIEDSAAPIHDPDGHISGAIMVFHDIGETLAMAEKMAHMAHHDTLTGLPNRILLDDRLERALQCREGDCNGALLYIDLDHFKHINDSLGHQTGDAVLKEAARRLVHCVRRDDTVSRQGGDEFVVLLPRLSDPRHAARVAKKIIESIEKPIRLHGQDLHLSTSIGIALYPQDSTDPVELTKQADTALYHAKHSGRGRYSYFTDEMGKQAEDRLRVEHALRQALQHDQLYLVYQPKVHWPEGTLTGAEALVRWQRGDGDTVSPADFIPLAEETGLITQIDAWVLDSACRQMAAWRDQGLDPTPVSVNVSLKFLDPDKMLETVRLALQTHGLPAPCLEIEVTESQMAAHPEQTVALMKGLRKLGVRLAVDDFGTGYSNLSYLSQYEFDVLKIDRVFVKDIPDNAKQFSIVRGIISMAQALGYQLIAEGVETATQARLLHEHGCPQMQGFLFSRPIDAQSYSALLQDKSPLKTPDSARAVD